MTADEARRHLQYSRWASTRLLDAVMALPAEQRDRDLGASHQGLVDTLTHILLADRIWLHRVAGTPGQASGEPVEIEWPRVQDNWEKWAAALTDADLVTEIDYKDMKGNPHRSA